MKSMSSPGSFKRTVTNREELPFQSELIASVKAAGGYGRKVSNPQLKGISDLLLAMPGFSLVQVECKDLGTLKTGFQVKSGITEHQKKHIESLNQAAGGLVGFYAIRVLIGETENCIFLKEFQEKVSYADMWKPHSRRDVGVKLWPDLQRIWHTIGVPQLAAKHSTHAVLFPGG